MVASCARARVCVRARNNIEADTPHTSKAYRIVAYTGDLYNAFADTIPPFIIICKPTYTYGVQAHVAKYAVSLQFPRRCAKSLLPRRLCEFRSREKLERSSFIARDTVMSENRYRHGKYITIWRDGRFREDREKPAAVAYRIANNTQRFSRKKRKYFTERRIHV